MRGLGAWGVPVALVAFLVLVDSGCPDGRGQVQARLAVTAALGGGDLDGFARATAPRELVFPDDHGPHPEFRTEWWYYTGNLTATGGRHWGFQLTFFRTALVPPASPAYHAARGSAWASDQVYLAHFALTDTRGERFHAWSRTSRGALGLAGAQAAPFRVWLEDWSVSGERPAGLPMTLRAAEGDVAVTLTLDSAKPPVFQGERGLSRKGPEPGNASFYYSLTRMPARGAVRLGAETFTVTGLAWMDREWSTSALGTDLVGWDWWALQLDDGRDLMFYRRRHARGGARGEPRRRAHGGAGHLDQSGEPSPLSLGLAPDPAPRASDARDRSPAHRSGAARRHPLLGGRGGRARHRRRGAHHGPGLRGAGGVRGVSWLRLTTEPGSGHLRSEPGRISGEEPGGWYRCARSCWKKAAI